jgi:CTP synthase
MSTKFIFVTGGVVSGIGKGITAAALGRLLKARGLKVRNQKFDPYINVDPGLMSPMQHGEVFITEDGAETDLDIGHYERFTDENLTIESDITSGMIYRDVIQREREGGYMGSTVQVVPHIINEIKEHIFNVSQQEHPDVVIIEIGGTVGDMESQPYLEAIRQVRNQVGRENVLFVHVTLIPYLRKAGEIKTKPTQHSVQKLLALGIQPDVLVCRSEMELDKSIRDKIALFCNVDSDCVIPNLDIDSVYQLPLVLEKEGLAKVVCRKLGVAQFVEPDLSDWQQLVHKHSLVNRKLDIALVGKYVSLHDAYLSVVEALQHAGIARGTSVELRWVSSEDVEKNGASQYLEGVDGVIIPGGFGPRGMNGMIIAAGYARENKIPLFGIGLGMQMSVVEIARSLAGIKDVHSGEAEQDGPELFILPQFDGTVSCTADLPMRRGAQDFKVKQDSRLAGIYGSETVSERHHHRREFNLEYKHRLEEAGLVFSGMLYEQDLVEAVEYPDHPWYVGVIYHPEFKSRPTRPHPLFESFVRAAMEYRRGQQ